MERRSFLKLLGVVGTTLMQPTLVLGEFSGEVLPPPPNGVDPRLTRNWVVYPNRKLGGHFGSMAYHAEEFAISPKFHPKSDPHEVFFKSALELQRRIGEATLSRLSEVPEVLRPHVEVVTHIVEPIHCRTKHCWDLSHPEEPEVGFDVVADLTIEVKGWGMSIDPRRRQVALQGYGKGWHPSPDLKVYSQYGEYPMEMPTHLDLGHMMRLSSQFQARDRDLLRRISRISLT